MQSKACCLSSTLPQPVSHRPCPPPMPLCLDPGESGWRGQTGRADSFKPSQAIGGQSMVMPLNNRWQKQDEELLLWVFFTSPQGLGVLRAAAEAGGHSDSCKNASARGGRASGVCGKRTACRCRLATDWAHRSHRSHYLGALRDRDILVGGAVWKGTGSHTSERWSESMLTVCYHFWQLKALIYKCSKSLCSCLRAGGGFSSTVQRLTIISSKRNNSCSLRQHIY